MMFLIIECIFGSFTFRPQQEKIAYILITAIKYLLPIKIIIAY